MCIVGAGPIGLLLGNLLKRRSVSVSIVKKQPKPYNLPRGVHLTVKWCVCFKHLGSPNRCCRIQWLGVLSPPAIHGIDF